MEAEAKRRLDDARGAMMRNAEEARRVLQLVLDGPLRVTPIDLPEGRRFQIEGSASFGRFLMTEQHADGRPNSVSPAGLYTLGRHGLPSFLQSSEELPRLVT